MTAAHTEGRLMPCRSHEDHTGPYFDIDDEDAESYAARPFVKLVTTDAGVTVANAHDLFEFAPGDAERLSDAWNCVDGLTLEQINRLVVAQLVSAAAALVEMDSGRCTSCSSEIAPEGYCGCAPDENDPVMYGRKCAVRALLVKGGL